MTALVVLAASATAFAELGSESRVLGVGRIQSESDLVPLDPAERLALTGEEAAAPGISVSGLATPIDREIITPAPAPPPVPSTSDGGWQSGLASAYGEQFIGQSTAIGDMVTEDSLGVAVPYGWAHLLGKTIEIEYNGIVVTAKINDTGPFAQWGRSLDLQPGVWKAFGFDDVWSWGVRTVRYRIVG